MGVYRRPDSPFWWMALEGTPIRASTDVPIEGGSPQLNRELKRQALEIYAARKGDLARGKHGLPTKQSGAPSFKTFAQWYESHVVSKNRGAEREREILKVLRGAFSDLNLSQVTRTRVEEWMTKRGARVSARTVNREVDLLKSMLRKAADLHHLDVSPLVGMKRLRVLKPRRRLLGVAEERKLLHAADAVEKALVILGIDTLVRMTDLLDVKRTDRRGAWLYVRDPKDPTQGTPFEVPLSRRAQQALNRVPKDGEYYFERYRGAKTARDRRGRVRRMLKKLCAAADVPYGRAVDGITFHWATRRTGATRLIRRKVDIKTVQQIGHWKRPDVVLEIYAESDRSAMLKAVGAFTPRSRKIKTA